MIGYKLKDGTIVEGVTRVPLTADGKEIKVGDTLRGSGGIFRVVDLKAPKFEVEHSETGVRSWFYKDGWDFVHHMPRVGEVYITKLGSFVRVREICLPDVLYDYRAFGTGAVSRDNSRLSATAQDFYRLPSSDFFDYNLEKIKIGDRLQGTGGYRYMVEEIRANELIVRRDGSIRIPCTRSDILTGRLVVASGVRYSDLKDDELFEVEAQDFLGNKVWLKYRKMTSTVAWDYSRKQLCAITASAIIRRPA